MMLHTKYQGYRACAFRQYFFIFSLCKTCGPWSGSIFLFIIYLFIYFWGAGGGGGLILNKLGRGPLGDVTYLYEGSRTCGFRQ